MHPSYSSFVSSSCPYSFCSAPSCCCTPSSSSIFSSCPPSHTACLPVVAAPSCSSSISSSYPFSFYLSLHLFFLHLPPTPSSHSSCVHLAPATPFCPSSSHRPVLFAFYFSPSCCCTPSCSSSPLAAPFLFFSSPTLTPPSSPLPAFLLIFLVSLLLKFPVLLLLRPLISFYLSPSYCFTCFMLLLCLPFLTPFSIYFFSSCSWTHSCSSFGSFSCPLSFYLSSSSAASCSAPPRFISSPGPSHSSQLPPAGSPPPTPPPTPPPSPFSAPFSFYLAPSYSSFLFSFCPFSFISSPSCSSFLFPLFFPLSLQMPLIVLLFLLIPPASASPLPLALVSPTLASLWSHCFPPFSCSLLLPRPGLLTLPLLPLLSFRHLCPPPDPPASRLPALHLLLLKLPLLLSLLFLLLLAFIPLLLLLLFLSLFPHLFLLPLTLLPCLFCATFCSFSIIIPSFFCCSSSFSSLFSLCHTSPYFSFASLPLSVSAQ